MEKKKIVFVIPSLKIGGIENALVNMLGHFDFEKYEVYAYVFHYDKAQVSKLDSRVHVLTGGKFLDTIAMTMAEARDCGTFTYLMRGLLAVCCKAFGSKSVFSFIFSFQKKVTGMDYAVAYSNNVGLDTTYFGANLFALKKIEAAKKLSWLHVDYEAMDMNNDYNNSEYRAFDGVIAVSAGVRECFIRCNPDMAGKTYTVYNVLPKRASQPKPAKKNNIKTIVTVGRLDPNKNQLKAIEIAKKLKDDGIPFKWLLVGDGQQRAEDEEAIKANGLQEDVIITGYRDDIDEVLASADLFVSTSLSESYGMAVVEAQAAGVPVVVKEYPAAKEIVNDKNGILVADYDSMYQEIKKLLVENDAYESLKENTIRLHDDDSSMASLYKILNEYE